MNWSQRVTPREDEDGGNNKSSHFLVEPYILLKRKQLKLALRIIDRLKEGKISAGMFLRIAKEVDKFKVLNYSRKRTNTYFQVRQYFIAHHLLSL